MLTPIRIDFEDNFINLRYEGSDDILYKTQKNIFEEEMGVIIINPEPMIPAYIINLNQFGTDMICGHIIDNLIGYLKNADLENILLVINFYGVSSISTSFCEQYIKFLLSTKSKVLSINQNTNINNTLSGYIEDIIEVQEV